MMSASLIIFVVVCICSFVFLSLLALSITYFMRYQCESCGVLSCCPLCSTVLFPTIVSAPQNSYHQPNTRNSEPPHVGPLSISTAHDPYPARLQAAGAMSTQGSSRASTEVEGWRLAQTFPRQEPNSTDCISVVTPSLTVTDTSPSGLAEGVPVHTAVQQVKAVNVTPIVGLYRLVD